MVQFFAILSGVIHIYIFVMESVLWGRPKINKTFGMPEEVAESNRLFAFNQGIYNLFLAAGALLGAGMTFAGPSTIANTLIVYSCLSMVGASLALLYSARHLLRPALIQGLPPLTALILLALHGFI